jgi:hypothetical protein
MKLPAAKDWLDKQALYADILRHCYASRDERISFYQKQREVYMLGVDEVTTTQSDKYRKIFSHIETVSSFLYAQDTTKFAIHLGATAERSQFDRTDKVAHILNDDWHDTDTDLIFGEALRWSLVYGCTIGKSSWRRGHPDLKIIDPHHFGVYREDVMSIYEQEALCHKFQMTVTELEARLAVHPNKAEILKQVSLTPRKSDGEDSGQANIVVSQVNPIVGNVNIDLMQGNKYIPKVTVPMVECDELWIFDDDLEGWRIVSFADQGVLIYDRPAHDLSKSTKVYLKGTHPFTPIRPRPIKGYFWGQSEVELLMTLQRKYNEALEREEKKERRAANPPKSATGFTFDSNEAADAWMAEGALITSDLPGSKMDVHDPTLRNDNPGAWMRVLDELFDELSGLPPAMKGLGTPGVRSETHQHSVVQVGGSRVKKRALLVEDSLDDIATKYVQLHQLYDDTHYEDSNHEKFICAGFTDDFVAKVDAHSNSPVFVEDQKDVADRALKAKAITRERYLEMIGAPNLPVLKQELRDKIEPAEREQAQKHEELEQSKLLMQAGKGEGLVQKLPALLRTARGAGK